MGIYTGPTLLTLVFKVSTEVSNSSQVTFISVSLLSIRVLCALIWKACD